MPARRQNQQSTVSSMPSNPAFTNFRFNASVFIRFMVCIAGLAASIASNAQVLATHGMAVFGGRDGLYASHLPMFHAPHNAQIVLAFHLQDRANDTAMRAALAISPRLWTMEPEKFDLDRLRPGHAEPLSKFTARMVQGHFERGGIERYANQTVVIDKILIFRPLDDTRRGGDTGRYRIIGTGRERFMLKEVDRRPDFDMILALKPIDKSPLAWPDTVVLPVKGVNKPAIHELDAALKKQLGKDAAVAKIIYFETGDLQ